ncbi:endonuclease V [Clostridium sp. YIM B02515]|uniref:Endonuclease V n=1 Tax=Clostridium rhizosphaerae TaxID=2803861 RepID=A0ABS1T512_9CLOT|nr:endonuclease V [Clostridium rhizosphaerae]MBL4934419.1 endonuclease V [Clostridium rhizosphaerae]
MKGITAACFDVYYHEDYAKSCCVVFKKEEGEVILSDYSVIVRGVEEYIPGQFYKRELPCILNVFNKVKEDVDLLITDSFVWLNSGKKGLGAHLYKALSYKIPVIGVAKTHFKDAENYEEIYRGESHSPLYVSSVGIELGTAAEFIKNLDGDNRIPWVLKLVDKLSRE